MQVACISEGNGIKNSLKCLIAHVYPLGSTPDTTLCSDYVLGNQYTGEDTDGQNSKTHDGSFGRLLKPAKCSHDMKCPWHPAGQRALGESNLACGMNHKRLQPPNVSWGTETDYLLKTAQLSQGCDETSLVKNASNSSTCKNNDHGELQSCPWAHQSPLGVVYPKDVENLTFVRHLHCTAVEAEQCSAHAIKHQYHNGIRVH